MLNQKAEEVLDTLLEGNRRFAGSSSVHPHQDSARREECLKGQKPTAAIIGCADSRIPPEVIFDCGIGDIFVIRVAGTVSDKSVIASIEYAVDHLNVPLVMVLGHASCGAVTAAVKGTDADGALKGMLESIRNDCREELADDTLTVDDITKRYTARQAYIISTEIPLVKTAINKNASSVVAAYYNLDSGLVEVLKQVFKK